MGQSMNYKISVTLGLLLIALLLFGCEERRAFYMESPGTVIISAVSPSGLEGDGWLELFNNGETPVGLDGWKISDHFSSKDAYQLPNVELKSQDTLRIYEKGSKNEADQLNFKINRQKEHLYLYDRQDRLVQKVEVKDRVQGERMVLNKVTGAFDVSRDSVDANASGMITVSHESGVYDHPLELSAKSEKSGVILHYTTEGETPTLNSPVLEGRKEISETVLIKISAFEGQQAVSVTERALVIEKSQGILPWVLSVEPTEFLDEHTGIYSIGTEAERQYPYKGANYWKDKKISAGLYILEDGAQRHAVEVRIFGGESRTLPQKSLKIEFKDKVKLKIDSEVYSLKELVLRNGGQDSEQTHIKNGFSSVLARQLGLDASFYQPVALYINSEYWGVMDLQQDMDANYIKGTYGIKEIDLIEDGYKAKEGDAKAWAQLLEAATVKDYKKVQRLIDVNQLADALIYQLYIANMDWPDNNSRFWREKADGALFKPLIYDSDLGFSDPGHNTLEYVLKPSGNVKNTGSGGELYRKMLKVPEFKALVKTRGLKWVEGVLSTENGLKTFEQINERVSKEMPKHCARWNLDVGKWTLQMENVKIFIKERPAYLKKQLQNL